MYLIGNFCSWKNMVLGKYARIDGQNSSRFCMTISIVVFVSTCFIAAWMALSSSIGPLGVGITLQQFMSSMPEKANLNNTDLHKEALKVNDSNLNMQRNENVMLKEPQRSEVSENDNLTMLGNGNVTPKELQSSEVTENDSNPNMQGNENVTPKESQSSEVSESHDSEMIDEKKDENISIPPNVAEKSISWNKEENKGSQEKDNGQLERVDTINQEVPAEKYLDSDIQKHDGDNETKQVGETETKVKESGGYPGKIPSAWINAKKKHDQLANQTENPSQGQHKTDVTNDEQKFSNGIISEAGPWPTQAAKSEKEKELEAVSSPLNQSKYRWKVCNVTAGPDFIPCLDNIQAIKKLRTTSHYEHRERHCPDEAPICLVPLPKGYKTPIKWPISRDMIWFSNVPHTKLVEYKGGQNWVKVYDRYLTFPGGGTQFKYGALHYIDYLEQSVPDIAWGRQSRVILDVGCGVASFGGYLFDRDVLTISLAPKDEHEAQVQFALERGIPAISAVMGTMRLPFPSMVFDIIHCARCRVPWHVEGGKLLLELNRVLRPGGYFIWSATPVYRKDSTNAAIWKDMSELTKSICWELVKVERDAVNRKAAAIYRKPVNNNCYLERQKNDPPFCEESDDPNRAWYTPLESCIHNVPTNPSQRGSQWPSQWPSRLDKAPYWLKGDEASRDFSHDYNNWKDVITNIYLNGSGIDRSSLRNVMDMRASYGGFAAALKDLKVWVMNVVPVNSSDTLPIIYERGLFGIYHDWCESFSTYPRSYDLLHANHLFSDLKKRCSLVAVMAEVDRILRPGAYLIIRDDPTTVSEVESMANSLNWNIKFTHSKHDEKVICVEKTKWRPSEVETISSVIG